MINLFKKQIPIGSPVNGKVVDLDEVNDSVFSDKIVGDGCAVIPEEKIICAPCSGKIVQIIETNHAFCILSNEGLEVLVHIGLDTVKLKGKGFKRLKEEGSKVKLGDPIMEVDFEYLKSQNKEIITPILITNLDKVKKINVNKGEVNRKDKIMGILRK